MCIEPRPEAMTESLVNLVLETLDTRLQANALSLMQGLALSPVHGK